MHNTLQKGQYVAKRFRADPGDVEIKEPDDETADSRRKIRMPVSSTAQDRDGDQFSEDGLEDLQQQFNDEKIPMFLDHGRGSRGSYYGTLGIVGRWDAAEIEQEGDIKVLYATGTPTDANPDADDAVDLIEDDMPVGASVGFRVLDYDGDRQDGYEFHKSDLLETSLVGIPSNPETVNTGTQSGIAAKGAAPGSASPALLTRLLSLDDESLHELLTDSALDAPGDTMAEDDTNTDDDMLERLVSIQEQTAETLDEQAERLDALETQLEERDTNPDATDGEGEGDDPDRRELSVILEEDADEKAVEEFETLKEHAEGGEVDLADSETKLFASEDSDDDTADDGGLI